MSDSKPIYDLIPLDEYQRPLKPIDEELKGKILKFKDFLFPRKVNDITIASELTQLPKRKLDRIVPKPDWRQVKEHMSDRFSEWINEEGGVKIHIIVVQPFSLVDEVLLTWASENKYQILLPPTADEIIKNSDHWLSTLDIDKTELLVIPNLESFFLRHHQGYNLLEQLFELINKSKIKVIIGINSWAYRFLKVHKDIINIGSVKELTLIEFDATRLSTWIRDLTPSSSKLKYQFRKNNDGSYLFDVATDVSATPKDKKLELDSKLFKLISSYSLGIPMISWELWRNSLRSKPDEEFLLKEEDEEVLEQNQENEHVKRHINTIWVLPWEKTLKLEIFEKLTRIEMNVLYELIIHKQISSSLLSVILMVEEREINSITANLSRLNLISFLGGLVSINPIAFPSISQKLTVEGYLGDGFK